MAFAILSNSYFFEYFICIFALIVVILNHHSKKLLDGLKPLINICTIGGCVWIRYFVWQALQVNPNLNTARMLDHGVVDVSASHAAVWIAVPAFTLIMMFYFKDGLKALMVTFGLLLPIHELDWYINYSVMNPQNITGIFMYDSVFVITLIVELLAVVTVYRDVAKVVTASLASMVPFYTLWDLSNHFAITLDLKTGITQWYSSQIVNLWENMSWYYAMVAVAIFIFLAVKYVHLKPRVSREEAVKILKEGSNN